MLGSRFLRLFSKFSGIYGHFVAVETGREATVPRLSTALIASGSSIKPSLNMKGTLEAIKILKSSLKWGTLLVMAKKKKQLKNKKDLLWVEAKHRCHLNAEDIKMAKEMGLNPRSLIKNIPSKSEQWKSPVKDWIHDMYQKRQKKAAIKKSRTPFQGRGPDYSVPYLT